MAWPSIQRDLGRPISALGVLLVAQAAGYLVASTANGPLVARFGTGSVLTVSAVGSALGLGAYALASPWSVLVAASVLVGAAAGALDAGVNAHVALHHGRRAMGLLHASFGVGATAGPLFVTALVVADRSWRAAYGAMVLAHLVLLVAFLGTRRRWSTVPRHDIPPVEEGRRRRGALVLGMLAFFFYTGLELSAGQWAFSFLTEHRRMASGPAGLWVASYWGALTVGRVALALGGHRAHPRRVLDGATAGAVIGVTVVWLDPGGLGVAALPLVGLCLAPIFPVLVSITPERLGSARTAHNVGYQLAAAGIGAAVLPGAVGLAVAAVGLDAVGPTLMAMALVLAGLHLLDTAVSAPRPPIPAGPRS